MSEIRTEAGNIANQGDCNVAAGKRDPYWDVVKGLLIFLVVLGHAVQYGGGGNFWGNPLFKGIYLFHMPLFAMVSGCFVFGSIHRHGGRYVGRAAKHLLVPAIFTTVACVTIGAARAYWLGKTPTWPGIYYYFAIAWFLVCIFECSVFAWLMTLFKSLWWRAACLFIPIIVVALCPAIPLSSEFSFLYPFFLLGAWVRYKEWPLGNIWQGVAAAAAYGAVFCVFFENWYVYRAPLAFQLDNMNALAVFFVVAVYLIRMAGGIAGCFLLLFIVKRLPKLQESRMLRRLGTSTLAIYLLQIYFWDFIWIPHCPDISIWLCFPLAIAVVALCYGIHRLCRRIPVLSFLMFGEQRKKAAAKPPAPSAP